MIICIDRSPSWRAQRVFESELSTILEALFRFRRGRAPASVLDALLLARVLDCSETAIWQHLARSRERAPAGAAGGSRGAPLLPIPTGIPRAYSPTKPA